MKSLWLSLFWICVYITANANNPLAPAESAELSANYQDELERLNNYLKTFDNGYYGYFEVKDGYLYGRFPSGKYTKTLIKDLGTATVTEYNRKVVLGCKSNNDCVFSTHTDSYHPELSFSQTTAFNAEELMKLLNDLVAAFSDVTTSSKRDEISKGKSSDDLDKYYSKIDILDMGSSSGTKQGSYQDELDRLNTYLKTFDNGYYGYFEVKDGYIYDRFKAGKYNKFRMEDMDGAIIQEQYQRVIFACKNNAKCISTDWKENGREEYTQFTTGSAFNYQELANLLNDFKDAYLGSSKTTQANISSSSGNPDSDKLQTALSKLNAYLSTFNPEVYKGVEVIGEKVYFKFFVYGKEYNSYIDINTLVTNTIIVKSTSVGQNEVKIMCKNASKCFYSEYSKNEVDHFRFFSNTVTDLGTMVRLVKEFISVLH